MKNVADIYPLSPMQELMLLHAVSERDNDTLFNQFCYLIDGELDLATFRASWQGVLDRHPALRSSFLWQELDRPVQVVHKTVALPAVEFDWRDKTEAERESELASFRERDRRDRFLPNEAPLMRLTFIRWTEGTTCVVWSSHHLIVDRWCIATILQDLFELYRSNREGRSPQLPRPGSYRDYIAWIQQQDRAEAERFWRRTLRGFKLPTRITREPAPGGNGASGQAERHRLVLEEPLVSALRAFGRKHGLTTSVLFQGAWALLLGRITGNPDVLFGAVVAGRPPELPGIESAVGSFINNVPVRVRLSAMSLLDWLRDLKEQQQHRLPFEHVSLTQIQSWCPLPTRDLLFDHLLVWLAPHEMRAHPVSIRMLPGELETAFPLTLAIAEGERSVDLHAVRSARCTTLRPVPEILAQLQSILEMIESAADRPLSDLAPAFPLANATDLEVVVDPLAPTIPNGRSAKIGSAPAAAQPVAGGREAMEPDLLEELLRSDWSEVLGRAQIDLDDNFFDLGGTSLLAARLHARVEAGTRMAVPLLALYQAATLRGMLQTLQSRDWPLTPGLVLPVQTHGSHPPLFCVASPEVNTIGYVMVARYLEAEQPVYVLQTPPTDLIPKRLDPRGLLELAESYVAALESVQPSGPVQLLGMCSGAHIAVEMARQLQRSGRTVRFLGLVNTWALYTRSNLYRVDLLRQKLRHYGKRVWTIATSPSEDRVAMLREIARRKLGQADARSSAQSSPRTNGRRVKVTSRDPWLDDFGWAKDRGEVERIQGRITVYRIRKTQVGRIRARDLGWRDWADETEVVTLPAPTHDAVLRQPHVHALAREVESRLLSSLASESR